MSDWRDHILRKFTPGIGIMTLVADPDWLLSESRLNESLMTMGFELLVFENSITFRFAYESKYRSRHDSGEFIDLIVVSHSNASSLRVLPFDLVVNSRHLSFSLSELFPNLSYPVLGALGSEDLELLYEAQERFRPGVLGENATKDFILRHVFEITGELIRADSDLLRVLLRRHYRPQMIPTLFLNRLVDVLQKTGRFNEWPLEVLFRDRSQFLTFLQERWPAFLSRFLDVIPFEVRPKVPGPVNLPFDNADVRVYIDNLFVEGFLQPIDLPASHELGKSWVVVGVRRDSDREKRERLKRLFQIVERDLPTTDSRHGDWLGFSAIWSQLNVLTSQITEPAKKDFVARQLELRTRVDSEFEVWIERNLGGLHNLPSDPPVMVHHIARYLAHQRNETGARIALVVFDGMSFDQWVILRSQLSEQKRWTYEEAMVFAWIPTLTSVSRQSIFAGKAPLYFAPSIYSTDKESRLWTQFWAEYGVTEKGIGYLKGLGDPHMLQVLIDRVSDPRLKVLGLVVDKVDRIMHGMELGTEGMYNQVNQWASEGIPSYLIELLLKNGFKVFLTSDHGNIEAHGCGRPREGSLAELRGERVRIYSDEVLRSSVAPNFPGARRWPSIGLPIDYLPLLAPSRRAFVPEGQRTVAHGGVTLEETVVPFIQVKGGH